MKWVVGGAAVLFVSLCWALGPGKPAEVRTGSSTGNDAPAEATARALRRLLEARELELQALRTRIRELEASAETEIYRDAEALGVVGAVRQSGLPERQQRRIAIAIVRESRQHGLNPLLVVALIRAESSFDNYAQSKVGALGLMQVMPDTGRWMASIRGKPLPRRMHLFDSELNVEIGTAYLASLLRRFGTLDNALVAYNAGPTAARRILADRSAKARFLAGYPRKVVREFRRLKANVNGAERAETSEQTSRRRG